MCDRVETVRVVNRAFPWKKSKNPALHWFGANQKALNWPLTEQILARLQQSACNGHECNRKKQDNGQPSPSRIPPLSFWRQSLIQIYRWVVLAQVDHRGRA